MKEKELLVEEIKELISVNKDDKIDINPNLLGYFTIEDLKSMKESLTIKKNQINKINLSYLDEIYEKTKKDRL